MWDKPLMKIKEIRNRSNRNIPSPVTDEDIEKFIKSVKEHFGDISLPKQYLDFLRTANGVEFNGTIIYGVDSSIINENINKNTNGFIENNEIWYENEWQKEFIFIGDGICIENDKPSGSLIRTFNDINGMIETVLNESLI